MKKSRFPTPGEFSKTLLSRVDSYFKENNKAVTGDYRIAVKTVVIVVLLTASYFAVYYTDVPFFVTIIAGIILSLSMVMVGFNIMHDGNHGSYSSSKKVNRIAGYSLDMIGASSYIWRHKHNVLHHTYTNINGLDDDLETAGCIRLSPCQKWKPIQRFQAFYAFPLYAIMSLYWFLYNDFVQFFTLKMGSSKIPKMKTQEKVKFIAGKLFYYSYMIVIPLFFNSWQFVLIAFLVIHFLASLTLSVIFQLAHTLEVNEFPEAEQESGHWENEWLVHQLKTTANFAPVNPVVTWLIGGLNHQVEHHLFPKISHVHYAEIAPIVKEVCREYGIAYNEYPTVWRAFVQHVKFLHTMGQNRAS